jgi:hypothetical protein
MIIKNHWQGNARILQDPIIIIVMRAFQALKRQAASKCVGFADFKLHSHPVSIRCWISDQCAASDLLWPLKCMGEGHRRAIRRDTLCHKQFPYVMFWYAVTSSCLGIILRTSPRCCQRKTKTPKISDCGNYHRVFRPARLKLCHRCMGAVSQKRKASSLGN